jgi:hypothetical protein
MPGHYHRIRSRPLRSRFFPIHHSLNHSFIRRYIALVTEKANKQLKINKWRGMDWSTFTLRKVTSTSQKIFLWTFKQIVQLTPSVNDTSLARNDNSTTDRKSQRHNFTWRYVPEPVRAVTVRNEIFSRPLKCTKITTLTKVTRLPKTYHVTLPHLH